MGIHEASRTVHSVQRTLGQGLPAPTSDRGWGLTAQTEVFPVMFDFLEELHQAGRLKKIPLEPEELEALCVQSDHTFDLEWLRCAG